MGKKYNIMIMELRSINNPLNECAWAQSRHALLRGFFMEEIWKPILGYNNYYEVSNLGNVRSTDRVVKGRHGDTVLRGKILKQVIGRGGYLSVSLSINGSHKSYHVHSLVSFAFIGKRKKGIVVNHKDSNKFNNSLQNIEYVNSRENKSHSSKKQMTGAFFNKKTNKWFSRICVNKKHLNLGTFNTAEEANKAYLNFLKINNMVNKYAV